MRLPELQARYAEVMGEETRAPNKAFLARKIAEALEARGASDEPTADTTSAENDPPESQLDMWRRLRTARR